MNSTIKILRPDEVWQPTIGAPAGNRNAFKTGTHTKEVRVLRKQVTATRRTMKRLIACAKEELRERSYLGAT